jgi:SAM-dependent methyltransferase
MLKGVLSLNKSWQKKFKEREEYKYWTGTLQDRTGGNSHFEYFFTTHFGIEKEFYRGKKILDIGCGPLGSLEWADRAARRVGLDPLADKYKALGTDRQAMEYVNAEAEKMPFADGTFDVVSTFNSLDHVEDLARVISEIKRVLKPGGLFLLITDTHTETTFCEPQAMGVDIISRFEPELELINYQHVRKGDHGIYQSLVDAVPYAGGDKEYGVLSARFVKK